MRHAAAWRGSGHRSGRQNSPIYAESDHRPALALGGSRNLTVSGSVPIFVSMRRLGSMYDKYRNRHRLLNLPRTLPAIRGSLTAIVPLWSLSTAAGPTIPAGDVASLDLTHARVFTYGQIEVGLGIERTDDALSGKTSNDGRAFLQWRSSH